MTLSLDTLIEQATRRELALRGSGRVATRSTGYDGPLPDAQPASDRPTLLWPDQRRLIPGRCWHCGANGANFDVDPPYGLVKSGAVTCLMCSRVQVTLKDAGATPPMTPQQFAELPKKDIRAKPAAPPARVYKPMAPVRTKAPTPCPDCAGPWHGRGRRCHACDARLRSKLPALLAHLSDGRPHEAHALREALDLGTTALRKAIQQLRKAGHPILTTRAWNGYGHGGVYRLDRQREGVAG